MGLYFDASDDTNTQLTYFSYPFSFTGSQILNTQTEDIRIEKIKNLPKGVQIDSVAGKEKFLVFFESITGKGSYFSWDPSKQQFLEDVVQIDISYKGATSTSLQRSINYYTK